MSGSDMALAGCVVLMLAGAAGTAFTKDLTRLVLSLGLFLVAVALTFVVLGSPLLAVSQVFVYVGGVLVLLLFALMIVRRTGEGRPRVESRHDIAAAATAVGVFLVLLLAQGPIGDGGSAAGQVSPTAVGDALLGPDLVAFELVGLLLLAALLAVLVIVKGAKDS